MAELQGHIWYLSRRMELFTSVVDGLLRQTANNEMASPQATRIEVSHRISFNTYASRAFTVSKQDRRVDVGIRVTQGSHWSPHYA